MNKSLLRVLRSQMVLVVVLVLGLAAAGSITLLERHVDASNQAQSEIAAVQLHLVRLENAPLTDAQAGAGSTVAVAAQLAGDSRFISIHLRTLMAGSSPPPVLLRVPAAVRDAGSMLQQILVIGAGSRSRAALSRQLPTIVGLISRLELKSSIALSLLGDAAQVYDRRAAQAKREAIIGSIATILLLLSVFVVFYRQARIARAENVRLLEASQDEAITDPLTGIGNRRAFKRDLEALLPGVNLQDEMLVAMFDLDGFKQYNDTFGHAAGDALLARLAGCLKATVASCASAYRMGGDEFCILAQTGIEAGDQLVHAAVLALTDSGEGWHIGCSWGMAWMPSESITSSDALRLADERMYAQKASRATAGHQATAALIQVLIERDTDLSIHINHVAELAAATAKNLGLADSEVTRVRLAAQLHDIGKTAIPESILGKAGPLDEGEWEFMRRHTLIGERIITAAPSLAHTAGLVRSSHERVDGAGYPDRLTGAAIPLGSRIIAVCDAYDAMIASRSYRDPMSVSDAVAELRRCAGTQFDPPVVEAFCAITREHEREPSSPDVASASAASSTVVNQSS